jgi:hypothetical protein
MADLQAGQRALEAGKASLTEANSKRDTSLVTQATAHFATAKANFLAASQLADNSRLLRYLEQIPAVGASVHSRHAAVDGVAEMGVALSEAGQELSSLDGQLIGPPGSGQAAHTLLTTLDETQAGVLKLRLDLDRAQRAAEQVEVQVLPVSQQATFLKARDAIAAAQSGLDEFGRLVPVLKEALGGNGVRTILIEQVNPAELRAGGGFIGTYSLVRTDHGTLTVIKSGDAYDLANPRPLPGQPGFIPQPSPYREVIPDGSWSFVDSNIYPDFPSNAKAAVNFVQPRLGINVDAVMSFDYYTVAKMLELTGPLAVPGLKVPVDAGNFIPQIVSDRLANDPANKAILSALAGPLMQRISSLPPDHWPALIAALNTLASERHLQAYFNNPSVENEINRVGWSGTVNPTQSADFLMEVESNYYGDKVNYFLSRHYSVVLTRRGGALHHQVTVDLVNNAGCVYERSSYRADFRLFVGANASSLSDNLRPVKYANPASPSGTQVMDGWVPDVACAAGRGRAVFDYDTVWPAHDLGVDQIYWQKQPGTVNDKVDVTWNDGSGHSYSVSGDLGQDRIISLSPSGVALLTGQPAQAKLPSLSLG